MSRCILALVIVIGTMSIAGANNQEGRLEVLLGSDGSLRFQPIEKVTYVSSGLFVTSEATLYSNKVRQLIDEERDFLPVKNKVVKARIVGLLTWRVIEEVQLVMVREGNFIFVKSLVNEEEIVQMKYEKRSSIALLMGVSFVFLTVGLW
jgi:hypothetical protein